MGLKVGGNQGLGNLVNFKPLDSTTITTNNNNKKKTKTIKISEQLYDRFVEHSRKYYNVEPYETILLNLLDSFDKNNDNVRWWNNK
jgi:hypothetical protein